MTVLNMSDTLKTVNVSSEPLKRQVTVQMTSEQYEQLFFQPSAPRGDLAKRLSMVYPPFDIALSGSSTSTLRSIR